MPGRVQDGKPRRDVDLREGSRQVHPRTPLVPGAPSRNPARELVQRLAAQTADELAMVREKYAGVEPIHFHWLVYTYLLEMRAEAIAGGDKELELKVLKELRMTSEQITAHEVGMSRAAALDARNSGLSFMRDLSSKSILDAEIIDPEEPLALGDGSGNGDVT
jgi:hypothetical protein